MSQLCLVLFVLMLVCSCNGETPVFMLASGITASEDMCVTVDNGFVDVDGAEIGLEPCVAAIAAGDGRELWSFQPNGQMMNTAGEKCAGVGSDGNGVVMMSCDASQDSTWQAEGSGQLMVGNGCLSMTGSAPGSDNVAFASAVAATSTVDAAHGASMAVDRLSGSYWASRLGDVREPVVFTIDFGAIHKLQLGVITWEFPAKSFAISTTTDGTHWKEVYSTDVNSLFENRVPFGSRFAAKVKLELREPHPVYGRFEGQALYGINSILLSAVRLRPVLVDCSKAAEAADARDKFFMSHVGEYDLAASKALRSELPSLEAAKSSLAATISELAAVLPDLASCRQVGGFADLSEQTALIPEEVFGGNRSSFVQVSTGVGTKQFAGVGMPSLAQVAEKVDDQNGIDVEAVNALVGEARLSIMSARRALR
jgi:hypothetical protein